MDVAWWGNLAEAALWTGVELSLAVATAYRSRGRWPYWFLAITFVVFAMTDVAEEWSGAWWKPWWLLLLKAG
jgi:hypothetical protein